MTIFNNFINEYATVILYTILTAIAGTVAAFIKKKYEEKCNTKTKREVVKQCVLMAEQVYKALDGEERKEKAIESISAMLLEKGITITPLEMEVLIEACVAEFNGVFDEEESEDVTWLVDASYYDDTILIDE